MDYIRTEADGQLALTQYAPGRKILIKIARNIYHYPPQVILKCLCLII